MAPKTLDVQSPSSATSPRSTGESTIFNFDEEDNGAEVGCAMFSPKSCSSSGSAANELSNVIDDTEPMSPSKSLCSCEDSRPMSPDPPGEVLSVNSLLDAVKEFDAQVQSPPNKKKVAFVEKNPTPLSPLSMSMFSAMSKQSTMSESILSPRNDDEDTLTLEDEATLDTLDEEEEKDKKASLLSKANEHPKLSTPRSHVSTPKNKSATPEIVEIPDDESEASLMVLMRYMGCTPIAYGEGPAAIQWLEDEAPMSNPSGKEFVFDTFDDEEDTLVSGDITDDDEYTYTSQYTEELKQDLTQSQSWTMKNEEVGVEIGLEGLVLESPPSSPGSSKASSFKKKLKNLSCSEKEADKITMTKTPKASNTKPKLTVKTVEDEATTERKEKLRKLMTSAEGIGANVLSDDELSAFLAGEDQPAEEKTVEETAGDGQETAPDESITEKSVLQQSEESAAAAAALLERHRLLTPKGSSASKKKVGEATPVSPTGKADQKVKSKSKKTTTKKKKSTKVEGEPAEGKAIASPTSVKSSESKKRTSPAKSTSSVIASAAALPCPAIDVNGEPAPSDKALSPVSVSSKTAQSGADEKLEASPSAAEIPAATSSGSAEDEAWMMALSPVSASSKTAQSSANENLEASPSAAEIPAVTSSCSAEDDANRLIDEALPPVSGSSSKTAQSGADEKLEASPSAAETPAATSSGNAEDEANRLIAAAMKEQAAKAEMQEVRNLEESPTTRSDKENSAKEESVTKMQLTVDTSSGDEEVPSIDSKDVLSPLSPTKKSVREVDELLSKTRQWLIKHNETQMKKRAFTPTTSGSDLAPLSTKSAATPSTEDREVMGNITAKAVLNRENSAGSSSNLKVNLSPKWTPLSPTSLAEQLRKAREEASLLTSSMESPASPKKSILEQLNEIRAKQREIELKQQAQKEQQQATV